MGHRIKRPELTPAQLSYKQEIESAQSVVDEAETALNTLIHKCPHAKAQRHESVYCLICGTGFGWACPTSPDQVCHYTTDMDGKVELTTGDLIDPPENHDPDFETDDSCIFCGQPEERK